MCFCLSYLPPCSPFPLCYRGSVHPIFRSFSEGLDPCVAVDSAYPWEELIQHLPVSPSWTSPSMVHFKSMLNFFRSCQTVSHQQCLRVLISSRACQHCYFPFKKCTYSHLSGDEVVSHCGLICVSLMIHDVEPLFMCILIICMSSLQKYLFRSFIRF